MPMHIDTTQQHECKREGQGAPDGIIESCFHWLASVVVGALHPTMYVPKAAQGNTRGEGPHTPSHVACTPNNMVGIHATCPLQQMAQKEWASTAT
jgi:hypothetical protein